MPINVQRSFSMRRKRQGGEDLSRVAAVVGSYVIVFWVLLPAFLFLTGLSLDRLVPVHEPTSRTLPFVGWGLAIVGAALMADAMVELWRQGNGLPISHLPPTEFVASGSYRWFRHPIYIGYTMVFAGASLLLRSPWSLLFCTPLLLAGWVWYAIFFEEPVLLERFGEKYRLYKGECGILLPARAVHAVRRSIEPLLIRTDHLLDRMASWTIMFRKGNFILVSYGAFVAAGALLFMQHIAGLFVLQGLSAAQAGTFVIAAALLSLLLGRMFWWFGHRRDMTGEPLRGLRRVGYVSWGGLAGLLGTCALFGAWENLNILMISDVLVRGMFVAYCVGRFGCLTYGCCYGLPSNIHGIRYSNPETKVIREKGWVDVPRHPTPVYSSLEGLLLFFALNAAACLPLPPGTITAAALVMYAVGRFFVESLRDRRRFLHGVITEGHVGCALAFSGGWLMLLLLPADLSRASPQAWTPAIFAMSLSVLPVSAVASLLILFVMGFHWKKVGTW